MSQNEFVCVTTTAQLGEVCDSFARHSAIAVDTEFTREKTYYPQLGLIQIASTDLVVCIDPIAISDLTPLQALFTAPTLTKVLHAARQDLEVLWQRLQVNPAPLFDTQLGAAFLGLHEQMSYAALITHYLGISLPKAHTRADWCQRPLSTEQLHYAADDVRYLIAVYPQLLAALRDAGRLDWCQHECDQLGNLVCTEPDPDDLWQNVGGQQRLEPQQLAVLRALARWREQFARHSNRPRQWILRDEVILSLAQQAPSSMAQLQMIDALPPATLQRHGETLLNLIAESTALPPEQWPAANNYVPLTPAQKSQISSLSAKLRQLAEQQHIATPLLATRRDLERLLIQHQTIPLLQGWRYELAGKSLLAAMPDDSRIALTLDQ